MALKMLAVAEIQYLRKAIFADFAVSWILFFHLVYTESMNCNKYSKLCLIKINYKMNYIQYHSK